MFYVDIHLLSNLKLVLAVKHLSNHTLPNFHCAGEFNPDMTQSDNFAPAISYAAGVS